MPAERTKKHHHGKRPASTGPDGQVRHKVPPLQQRDGLMGVSKLKSAIRQTKRLLAKVSTEAEGWGGEGRNGGGDVGGCVLRRGGKAQLRVVSRISSSRLTSLLLPPVLPSSSHTNSLRLPLPTKS